MKLFVREEINTSRQFEFDLAKAVCILGMVFVHCFETFSAGGDDAGAAYYITVIVLDAIFGAGTFMACMGLGIAYSWKGNADKLIKRGITIFLLGYLLNIVRDALPCSICCLFGCASVSSIIIGILCTDIMPFAGLALLLFGLLKKWKLSDLQVFLVALAMSVAGSFIRFLEFDNYVLVDLLGLFVGTYDPISEDTLAAFPLFNWFIIVVMGYLYAQAIRRCTDKKKYYTVAFPASAVILAVYMLICIPNKLGMMNGDLMYYYHMTTLDALVLMTGMVFATSMYYFISKIISVKVKSVITRMSANINTVYCIHWVIIGWTYGFMLITGIEAFNDTAVFLSGIVVYIVANAAAWIWKGSGKKQVKLGD